MWLAFLLVSVLTGFTVAVFQLHRLTQFNQIDEQLERRVAALSRDVRGGPPPGERSGHPPPESDFAGPPFPGPRSDSTRNSPPEMFRGRREIRLSPPTLGLFNEAEQNTFYFAIWSRGGAPLKRSANAPAEVPLPERLAGDTRTHLRMRQTFREAFHFTELGDCILAGRSINADLKAVRGFTWWLLAAGGAVLALGLGGGWWLTTRAIRPVEQISAAASRISAGNLSERISGANTGSELGRLAGVLNSTFARLEAAFAQQKQFTADASHELRTPLAVIISEAQTALAHQRSGPEYRETVEACLDTAQQMRRLTESLLELARFDAGQERLQRDAFDLAEMAGACVERIRPLAARNGLQIQCDLVAAKMLGDADRVGQVISNLLANAIDYNKPNGEIRVSTRAENGGAVLTVFDTGHGIAAEDVSHIFERFYRADRARSRGSGHSGLGLAICKAIVEAHGGSISVSSQLGLGATFTVRMSASSGP